MKIKIGELKKLINEELEEYLDANGNLLAMGDEVELPDDCCRGEIIGLGPERIWIAWNDYGVRGYTIHQLHNKRITKVDA